MKSAILFLLLPLTALADEHKGERQETHSEKHVEKQSKSKHEAKHKKHHENHHSVAVSDVEGPFTWGNTRAMKFHKHYFSGAMDDAAFKAAKDAGVEVVVDLRQPSEIKTSDADIAKKYGLSYTNVPVDGSKPFEKVTFDKVEKIFSDSHGKKTLVYCASGNRAGAWFASHVSGEHKIAVDEAVAIAKKVGMTSAAVEANLRNYLSR